MMEEPQNSPVMPVLTPQPQEGILTQNSPPETENTQPTTRNFTLVLNYSVGCAHVHCRCLIAIVGLAASPQAQGSFPAGTPGNGVPKVILTVGRPFKPAVGELYKKLPVYTKIRLFEIQNPIFLGRGLHPLPTPPPRRFRRLDPRLQRPNSASNSAPMAPRPPHLLILEPPLFGSHTSFSTKRSLLRPL